MASPASGTPRSRRNRDDAGSGPEQPQRQPWDRFTWPVVFDASPSVTYEAVGRALTHWSKFEGAMTIIFGYLVHPNDAQLVVVMAYTAVRTFEGRRDMMRDVVEVIFLNRKDHDLYKRIVHMLGRATNYSGRRNEIAHGVVEQAGGGPLPTYALVPSFASGLRHSSSLTHYGYGYSSKEISHYAEEFAKLTEVALEIFRDLACSEILKELVGRPLPPLTE